MGRNISWRSCGGQVGRVALACNTEDPDSIPDQFTIFVIQNYRRDSDDIDSAHYSRRQ
jgi:hypothetical protein